MIGLRSCLWIGFRRWLPVAFVALGQVALTFPWDLQGHAHWYKVSWIPLATGVVRLRDLVANFALYFPLGYFMPIANPKARVTVALAMSATIAAAMELAQVWSHTRFPSATDVALDIAGGVAGALWARPQADQVRPASVLPARPPAGS